MIGQTLAHYRITAAIGAGGMGQVYRATDTRLGRDVALKVLPTDMAHDAERLARFQREARAVAAINHPHIVTIHSVEEADGVHFLTMELVEGQSLDRLIPAGGLPVDRIHAIAMAIADALDAAHQKGIVHRDLKPANVMVTASGWVKVLDFGLAKDMRAVDPADATVTSAGYTALGVVMGTPAYMSPEQVAGRVLDHRTDLFSLGVMLYEMATGRRPFAGASSAELMSTILRDAPPSAVSVRRDLPASLGRVIDACLRKDSAARPESAQAIRSLLQGSGAERPSSGSGRAGAPKGVAVVVLPFVNRSPDPGNEYFSDGLTEEIITDLSGIDALKVISRNSAMALKGTASDTRAIAAQLGVTHVVSGSVRRAGDALRVTAELIEAASDTPVWSEKYSGTMADVFGIQEEIARKIVAALKVKLTDSEERQAGNRPIQDVVAYDCYLRARQEMYGWTPESLERAARLLVQARGIVGDNALLLATEGQISWLRVNVMFDPDERHLDHAADCARQCLAVGPDDALGLFLRGILAGLRGDGAGALRDVHRAHELRPGDPNILVELCRFANSAGVDIDDYGRQVVAIDPLTPVTWGVVTFNHFLNGRSAEAVPTARRLLALAPEPSMFHVYAGWAFAQAGLRDEAVGVLEAVGKALDGTLHGSWAMFLRYALDGDAKRASAEMTPLLARGAGLVDHNARTIADGYALIGHHDDALRWIRIAMGRGFINHPFLAVHDPFLSRLRSDPRFDPLMQEIKARRDALAPQLPRPLRLVPFPGVVP